MALQFLVSGYSADSTAGYSINFGQFPYQQPSTNFPPTVTIVSPYSQTPGVKSVSKELRIVPSLKGFDVTLVDVHGNAKSSEYSQPELIEALPDLLAKLKKEPKEE